MQSLSAIIPWIQIILSVAIVILVLLQQSEAGLGSSFGSTGGSIQHTRRGVEKGMFILTIVLGSLFVIVSLIAFKI